MSTDLRQARHLIECDWVVDRAWDLLHHPTLTDDQALELADGQLEDDVTLACGVEVEWVSIPGTVSRMGCYRCPKCCQARGLPAGKGSPKNDPACRRLLGLDAA